MKTRTSLFVEKRKSRKKMDEKKKKMKTWKINKSSTSQWINFYLSKLFIAPLKKFPITFVKSILLFHAIVFSFRFWEYFRRSSLFHVTSILFENLKYDNNRKKDIKISSLTQVSEDFSFACRSFRSVSSKTVAGISLWSTLNR